MTDRVSNTSHADSDIRAFWRKHGGQQHGPIVEHMTIAETKFYPLMRAFIATERERCAKIAETMFVSGDKQIVGDMIADEIRTGHIEKVTANE